MSLGLREHRQLLAAAKALLNRLEQRGRNTFAPMTEADWRVIVAANYAIAESRDALEIGTSARKAVNRI